MMFSTDKIRNRLKKGELVIWGFLRLPDPSMAEVMALAGVELIVVDNEHYPFNPETIIHIVRACNVHGAACAVRLPNAEPSLIAQVMDLGVNGIMIPSVDTEAEARQIVSAVNFAPKGNRGFCPITRAAHYGYDMTPSEFAAFSNDNTLIIIQIETKTGIENADKILAIPEIDIVQIGPSDISASYGLTGQNGHPIVQAAVASLREKINASGRKFNLLSVESDQQCAMAGFSKMVTALKAKLP